jgi:hypothetical protein
MRIEWNPSSIRRTMYENPALDSFRIAPIQTIIIIVNTSTVASYGWVCEQATLHLIPLFPLHFDKTGANASLCIAIDKQTRFIMYCTG